MHWVAWGCGSAGLCLGGVFGIFDLADFWAWVLCGSLWWGPKCHTGPTWVCEPIGALGAMHPWAPGPNLDLGQPPGRPHKVVENFHKLVRWLYARTNREGGNAEDVQESSMNIMQLFWGQKMLEMGAKGGSCNHAMKG